MKKLIITLLVISQFVAVAQQKKKESTKLEKGPHAFAKKDLDLSIGLGLGIGYGWGRYYTRFSPPVNLMADIGVTDNISIGGCFSFTRARSTWIGNDWHQGNYYQYRISYVHTFYIVGFRGAYHFGDLIGVEELDAYGGLMLGNAFHSTRFTHDDPYKNRSDNRYYQNSGGFIFGGFVGGRYYFKKNIALYGEFGWGLSYANVGLTFKL